MLLLLMPWDCSLIPTNFHMSNKKKLILMSAHVTHIRQDQLACTTLTFLFQIQYLFNEIKRNQMSHSLLLLIFLFFTFHTLLFCYATKSNAMFNFVFLVFNDRCVIFVTSEISAIFHKNFFIWWLKNKVNVMRPA
jgi:hypothetical protein